MLVASTHTQSAAKEPATEPFSAAFEARQCTLRSGRLLSMKCLSISCTVLRLGRLAAIQNNTAATNASYTLAMRRLPFSTLELESGPMIAAALHC